MSQFFKSISIDPSFSETKETSPVLLQLDPKPIFHIQLIQAHQDLCLINPTMNRPIRNTRGRNGNIAAKLDNAFVSSGFEDNFTGTATPTTGQLVGAPHVVDAQQEVI